MFYPTASGIFGLSMVTFVAASQKMGWTTGVAHLIPWALLLPARWRRSGRPRLISGKTIILVR